jgi:hypothetical protein
MIRTIDVNWLTVLLAAVFVVSCSDDSSSTPGADAGDASSDVGGDEVRSDIDPALIGIYSFVSATGDGGTMTTEWQSAPGPGAPDRQERMTGGITTRADGTFSRTLKELYRNQLWDDAEPVDENATRVVAGTWSVDGDRLTGLDSGATEPNVWTYTYDASSGLLTLDAVDPGEGEATQFVWHRETLDTDLVDTWDIVSMEFDDPAILLTTENQALETPMGTMNVRVAGGIEIGADGFFSRQLSIMVEDVEEEDFNEDGIAWTAGGLLVTEEAEIARQEWEYTLDSATGRFSQVPHGDGEGLVEIVWERRQE